MYHFYDVVINDKTGVPLGGVIVRVYDDAGSIVPLYADENGEVPIEAVSGLANAAVTDDAGNYNFYVSDGTYDIQFFVGDAVLYVLPNILMGFPDVTGKAQADALGVSGNADSMGVFSGSIIPDNQSAKQALQALEYATEQRPTNPQLDIVTNQTSAAIQSVVNSSSDNGQRVDLLKRDYPLDAALTSGSKSVEYQGAGPEATRLLVDGPRSAIEHGLDSQVYYASLSIRNLSICATSAAIGTAQTAINAKFDKSSGGFLLENVVFRPFSDSYDFAQYVHATGATRTTFRNVRALGSTFDADSVTDVQVAFRFTSNNNADKSYEYVFDDMTVYAEQSGFLFEVLGAPGNSGSLEGITMTNVRGRSNYGPFIDFKVVNGGWKPPFFTISNGFNYQGTGAIAHFDGIESLTIENGWNAFDAAITGSPTLNQIQLRNARKVVIRNQTFRIFDLAKLQWVISIEGGCSDIVIEDCTFIYDGSPTVTGGGIFKDASAQNVTFRNIKFVGWPSGLPKIVSSDGQEIFDAAVSGIEVLGNDGASFAYQNNETTGYNIYSTVIPPGYFYYSTGRFVLEQKAGTTVQHGSAVDAYVINRATRGAAPNEANAVGYFAQCATAVNNSSVWGINTACNDDPSNTAGAGSGRELIGYEADFEVSRTGTIVQGCAMVIQGATAPAGASAYSAISRSSMAKWSAAFVVEDGSSVNGIEVGAALPTGPNVAGTPNFYSYRNGSAQRVQIGMQAVNGVMQFSCTDASTPDMMFLGSGNGNAYVTAAGPSANINLNLSPKGTGKFVLTVANIGDFADDTAASAGGVQVGAIYRTGSILKVRVS